MIGEDPLTYHSMLRRISLSVSWGISLLVVIPVKIGSMSLGSYHRKHPCRQPRELYVNNCIDQFMMCFQK